MHITRTTHGHSVVDTDTGLIWRTLPTRDEAYAWLNEADRRSPTAKSR